MYRNCKKSENKGENGTRSDAELGLGQTMLEGEGHDKIGFHFISG